MRIKLILDTPILAMICHPSKYQHVRDWFQQIVSHAPPIHEISVSVLSLYETQRGLSKQGATQSLKRFEKLVGHLQLIDLGANTAKRAAMFSTNQPNGFEHVSDADLLIAAQAAEIGATLVTNDKALQQVCSLLGVSARDWSDVDPSGATAA